MTLLLKLIGKFNADRTPILDSTVTKIAVVDLEKESEVGDLYHYRYKDGNEYLFLGKREDGFWNVVEVYEMMEPTAERLEGKYTVCNRMDYRRALYLITEAKRRMKK